MIDRDDPVVQHLDQQSGTPAFRRSDQRLRYRLGIKHRVLLAPSASWRNTWSTPSGVRSIQRLIFALAPG